MTEDAFYGSPQHETTPERRYGPAQHTGTDDGIPAPLDADYDVVDADDETGDATDGETNGHGARALSAD